MSTEATDLVIGRSVTVRLPPEEAFRLFTDAIGTWWPLDTHSRGAGREDVTTETAVMEGREGGRVYEQMSDGTEASWGTIVAWEPPTRVVISWHVNPDRAEPTEVEVRFSPAGDGTRVDLEHRGWERLGADAVEARSGYHEGWELVLARFAGAAETN